MVMITTQADWEMHLKKLYASVGLKKGDRAYYTFNELVHALRMDKSVSDYNITVEYPFDLKYICIPSVKETYIPLRDLKLSVVSINFEPEFLDFCEGMIPLKVKLDETQ